MEIYYICCSGLEKAGGDAWTYITCAVMHGDIHADSVYKDEVWRHIFHEQDGFLFGGSLKPSRGLQDRHSKQTTRILEMESELFRMSQNVETHLPSIGGACCNKLHTELAGDSRAGLLGRQAEVLDTGPFLFLKYFLI